MRTLFVSAVLFVVAVGCGVPETETAPDELATVEQEAKSDPCAVVRCAAGTVCKAKGKTASCVVDPNAGGVSCGFNTCAVGDVCCNASCGICTPPDGVCTQQFCG